MDVIYYTFFGVITRLTSRFAHCSGYMVFLRGVYLEELVSFGVMLWW